MRPLALSFLISLFLFSNKTTFAQEKQFDATWEQTIDFLSENRSELLVEKRVHTQLKTDDHDAAFNYSGYSAIEFSNRELKITNFVVNEDGNKEEFLISVDLKNLKSAEFKMGSEKGTDTIELTFQENSVLKKSLSDPTKSDRQSHIIFGSCRYVDLKGRCVGWTWNIENGIIRVIYQAFRHLAYLANED